MKIPHRYLLPVLSLAFLALAGCGGDKEEAKTSRYSTQTFALVGGMTLITQITDHELNKLYYYKLVEKEGLVLQSTIDLTKAGDQTILAEFQKKVEADAAE